MFALCSGPVHLNFITVNHCLALVAGDALADGSQAGFNSTVDNVYQQSLAMDATQATTDWQVCTTHIIKISSVTFMPVS